MKVIFSALQNFIARQDLARARVNFRTYFLSILFFGVGSAVSVSPRQASAHDSLQKICHEVYGNQYGDPTNISVSTWYECIYEWIEISDHDGRDNSGHVRPGGGGAPHTSGNKAPTSQSDNRRTPESPCDKKSVDQAADPISLSSGAKIDTITDFALPGEMGLRFERHYNSRHMCLDGYSCDGLGAWTTNLDYYLDPPYCEFDPDLGHMACTPGLFIRPDGSRLYFRRGGGHGYSTTDASITNSTANLTINDDGTYTLLDEDARILTFNGQGTLMAIKDSHGIGWTLTRPDSNTVVVTHTNGQSFKLVVSNGSLIYGTAKQIRVTDPAGNVYLYDSTTSAYDGEATPISRLGALNKVTLPGSPSTVISYVYYPDDNVTTNGRHMLLKEVDYNGIAHDITDYDSAGRATMSSLADGNERTSIAYGSNATGPTATVTNPSGHVNVYQYDGVGDLVSITGNAATNCPATYSSMSYDANGFMTLSTDNNGNVTKYTYDANGLLQQKIEAAGTSVQRTIDYVWDAESDRLLSVTVGGWSKTTYTYDSQGWLASEAVTNLSGHGNANQTLTTTYARTMYGNGLVHTQMVTHPSGNGSNQDIYTFDSLGRLISMANALGQTVTYSNYNALGLPGSIVGPNGDKTDYTYDARGRVATKKTYPNGSTATWNFTYDGFGLPASETDPDGKITLWNRNATTGRVMVIGRTEKDGDSTETLGYNANGDVTSDVIQRGSDIGLSTHTSYDALGRVYQKTGNHGQMLTYSYDGNGNVVSVTNAAGHVVSYQYDAFNRVVKVTESGGGTFGVPTLNLPSGSTTGSYTVSWTGAAVSYNLQEQLNGGAWSTVYSGSAGSQAISGKTNGTWGYRVRECNGGGCGAWSATGSVSVLLPPPAPSSISVPATSTGSLTVSWTGANTATSYQLEHQKDGGAWSNIFSGNAISMAVSETATGSYVYRVKGCNASGCGAYKTSSAVAVTIPPAAPVLTVPSNSSDGGYTVGWSASSGASSYILQEQVDGGGWTTIQSGSATSRAISGKFNGTYGYQVVACNGSVCGPWSGVKSVNVLHVPATPTGLSATIYVTFESDTRPPRTFYDLYASWSPSPTATSYDLQYCTSGGSCAISSTSSSPWIVTAHGTSYTTNVRACNASGCSAWSATVTPSVVR